MPKILQLSNGWLTVKVIQVNSCKVLLSTFPRDTLILGRSICLIYYSNRPAFWKRHPIVECSAILRVCLHRMNILVKIPTVLVSLDRWWYRKSELIESIISNLLINAAIESILCKHYFRHFTP
jgi:(2Fe-2S) ferredoxin